MAPLLYVAFCLLAYAVVQKRLTTTALTGPMVFVAFGLLASSSGLGMIESSQTDVANVVDVVFQATLVLVLFTDAAALHFSSWRADAALPGRLLGVGLPLTVVVGGLVAAVLLTDLGIWEAAIIGAIVAPTDAALGQAVIANPRVPERIRQALDVESGLNDGVSLPFVLIFIGLAQESADAGAIATFASQIGIAVAVGVAVGMISGRVLVRAAKAGWMSTAWSSIAVISIAGIAFMAADGLGGSGFISTFVAGLAYGGATRGRIVENEAVAADLGEALVQVSFLLFGALVLEPALGSLTWPVLVVAVLALTVVRMGPVALALIGTGMKAPTVLYMGWFGPRGLATIVFAALVVTEADLPGTGTIVTVAAVTVGLSVLAHGMSAYPGSQRYASWIAGRDDTAALGETEPVHQHRFRSRTRGANEAMHVSNEVHDTTGRGS